MRLLFVGVILLFSAPAAAQSFQQKSISIECRSQAYALRYFCLQYQILQEAAWDHRQKLPGDMAEFSLRLNKFYKNKIEVRLAATLGNAHYEGTRIVPIDSRHLAASASKVVEATTATLDLWDER
jgi:hypothetical protein